MSRVYDALRQWNREKGLNSIPAEYEEPTQPRNGEEEENLDSLRWDEIADVVPLVRPDDHLITLNNGRELGAEKFRVLQSRLRQFALLQKIKLVVITSAVPEDGKSLIATNLAVTLAASTSLKVLLLEGDLHKPTLAKRLGLANSSGLAECLQDGGQLEKYCYHLRNSNLWVFPAGHAQQHPMGLLQSVGFHRVLTTLGSAFDWILIDAPPLLPLADAAFWAQQSDRILLVVRHAHTPRALLRRSLEVIDTTKLLGVILNDCQPTEHDYYRRYYYPNGSVHPA